MYMFLYDFLSLNRLVLRLNHADEHGDSFTFTTVHSIMVELNIFVDSYYPGFGMYFCFVKSSLKKKKKVFFCVLLECVKNSMDSGVWLFRFESRLTYTSYVASYLISLCLSFPTYKMRAKVPITS